MSNIQNRRCLEASGFGRAWLGLGIAVFVLSIFSLGSLARAEQTPEDFAEATIVVFNRQAPDSIALARFYAKARQIPDGHLVGLECPDKEEITRQQYDETIAEPLRKIFVERKWWRVKGDKNSAARTVRATRIHFVALLRGMPLKIRAVEKYEGDQPAQNPTCGQNQAAVDSELAMLGDFSRQISGAAHNPYFQRFLPIGKLETPLLLVTRLDGPSDMVVRQMISDAVETEKTGLWGRGYVDGAGFASGSRSDGDLWLKNVVKGLRRAGVAVVYDTNLGTFPSGFPMNNCALYYGWYAGDATGPFLDPGFRFLPGAVAVHIHSFSASTLRSVSANWVGPLLSHGAAASLGSVYEPYLQLTAHLDIFNDRLLHGFTFAESAYMAMPVVSWMDVAVGDPLYRPCANWLEIDPGRDGRKRNEWQMYHEFAVRHAELDSAEYVKQARAAALDAGNASMLEDLALTHCAQGDLDAALSDLREARSIYSNPDDILRIALEQTEILRQKGDRQEALAVLRSVDSLVADSPAAGLLRRIENEINPGPPSPQEFP